VIATILMLTLRRLHSVNLTTISIESFQDDNPLKVCRIAGDVVSASQMAEAITEKSGETMNAVCQGSLND